MTPIDNVTDEMKSVLIRAWLIVRLRPFFKCPLCNGAGGEMSGYYEPEWSECECWPRWELLEDHGMTWPIGRLPFVEWCRARLSMKLKLGHIHSFRSVLQCKLGWHSWLSEEVEPRLKICGVCWNTKRTN